MEKFQETISRTQESNNKVERLIPLHEPVFRGNEKRYLEECIDSTLVSSAGKFVDLFERQIVEYTGAKHAVACVNGTSALQVSLRLAGVRPGDEVIVPTLTFIAPVNAITYNGAKPVFMDSDRFYNIDVEKTIEFIRNETELNGHRSRFIVHRKTGRRIAAIMPVHVWGNAAWLDELVPLCKERNIAIVEDASESLGTVYLKGKYSKKHTGTIGQIGCLSFNGNKIITTGGGGMILTDDEKLAEKARYLTTQAKDDPVRYIHNDVGYNFRLTSIQAALGVAQLEQMPLFLKQKKKLHLKYVEALNTIEGLTMAGVPNYAHNSHWMNLLWIDSETYGEDREGIMARLEKNSIQTRPVWALNHLQKPYKDCRTYKIDRAEELVNNSLCLPSSTSLRDYEIQKVIDSLS